jgi:hypothetical protein
LAVLADQRYIVGAPGVGAHGITAGAGVAADLIEGIDYQDIVDSGAA